jgi:hypothetical protein
VRDSDYFHLMAAVLLVLMMLVMAGAWDWLLRHPELARESVRYAAQSYGGG